MNLLQTPAFFGHYRLSSRIATGGMAEVYVGRRVNPDGTVGPLVAVKRLLPHLVRDASIRRMFLNEARITEQIHHPNVVKIIELGEEAGEPYIAMELLEGRSFAELRQRAAEEGRRVPVGITLRVLTEACRGLDAGHRAVDEEGRPLCIVHRDFTPDNIHVGMDGRVCVIDFGIAKAENLGAGTEPGTLKGKFFYMSPEMISGKPVDHRADLFAAGVMLYEQLCGRRPFTGHSPDEVLDRIAEGKPRRPSEFAPSVPRALEEVCLTALARDPEARFRSLDEFITAIEEVGGSAELASAHGLATYLAQLFPADDPKRQSLRLALQADPSLPGIRPGEPVPGAPSWHMEQTAVQAAPPQAMQEKSRPAQVKSAPGPRLGWRLPALAAALLLLGGGAVGLLLFPRGPASPPSQRLAAARALADPAGRAALLKGLEEDPRATAGELEAAAELLVEPAPQAALALAEALEARAPDSAAGFLAEARACVELRLGKRAEAALSRAEKLAAATDPRPDLLLADLREKQGDLGGALEALGRARKKEPAARGPWLHQGNLLSQAERLDEAAAALSAFLESGFDADAAAELAFVRFRQGKPDEARTLLRKALEKAPRLYKAHYYLGAVLFRRGDIQGATRAYREADALTPADPRALAALCDMQAQGGDTAGAEETRRLLLARFPRDARALTARCAK